MHNGQAISVFKLLLWDGICVLSVLPIEKSVVTLVTTNTTIFNVN